MLGETDVVEATEPVFDVVEGGGNGGAVGHDGVCMGVGGVAVVVGAGLARREES